MRPLILSVGGCVAALGVALAAGPSAPTTGSSAPQLPVGQVFKDFQFPLYEDGQLKATLAAAEAKGITLNRAEAIELKIELYENGKVSTTITSPKADLYVTDRKMRTKNTVRIVRDDMEATAQTCDFDLGGKQYLLRENVKVTLKNFNSALKPKPGAAPATPAPAASPASPTAYPPDIRPAEGTLDVPGAVATNAPAQTPPP